ncbi:MAG: hypothetical protein KF897_03465 [Opitutaceae bacterium]|nr:hypothetical protein [Opitutaceae bacterium]
MDYEKLTRELPKSRNRKPQMKTSTEATALSLNPLQGEQHAALLKELAAKHIWWKTPEEAMKYPSRIVAQTMDRGSIDDINALFEAFGEDYLKSVVTKAEAGQFSARSWHYWHCRLGLASHEGPPPLPVRKIP